MSWSIDIAFTSPEDGPVDMLDATRALPTDEARDVARQLVIGAFTDGWGTSAGALLDHLEKATPSERRALLDRARVKAGLESTEDIDFRERHKQHQRNALASGRRTDTQVRVERVRADRRPGRDRGGT